MAKTSNSNPWLSSEKKKCGETKSQIKLENQGKSLNCGCVIQVV